MLLPNWQKTKVLFKIRTIDVPMLVNNKPTILKGGDIYEVIAYHKEEYYITNKEYKPDVPQLIPWNMAERISEE